MNPMLEFPTLPAMVQAGTAPRAATPLSATPALSWSRRASRAAR